MKFVLSYSCGKDSTLALHKMIHEGHEPVGLLVMMNREMQRSWFHGVDMGLLNAISESLGIPLILCETSGEEYHTALENGLRLAMEKGAEIAVFGDIDIDDHLIWCKERCDAVGIKSIFPLWRRNREEIVREILSLGYKCVIKCVSNDKLPKNFLGKVLDESVLEKMKRLNVDICGENGEYHTVVLDGLIFNKPIDYECLETLNFGNISAINIVKRG